MEDRGANDQEIKAVPSEAWRSARNRFRGAFEAEVAELAWDVSRTPERWQRLHNLEKLNERNDIAYKGPLFGIEERPGFILAPTAVSKSLQRGMALRALNEFCKAPHATNVDGHMHRSPEKRPRLAWASLGYQFDWTARRYTESKKSPFPEDLAKLTKSFAEAVPGGKGFKAQAAIVNFYKGNGNMGCHVDDSEDDQEKPVVSFTMGLPAIFLLGTRNRDDPPIPVLLRAGDVMMLSGESRLCFHGVAAILPRPVPLGPNALEKHVELPKQVVEVEEEEEWQEVDKFLASQRLNFNVRQVLLDGEQSLR